MLALLGLAAAGNWNCGTSKDHLQNLTVTKDPASPSPGEAYTVTVQGSLDEALTQFSIAVALDLDIPIVGKKSIDTTVPVKYTPGFPQGEWKVVVGPLKQPAPSEGGGSVTGQIHVTDAKGEQVACISVGSGLDWAALAAVQEAWAPQADGLEVKSCSGPSDHMKNLNVVSDITDTSLHLTTTGNLDEALTTVSAAADLTLKVLFKSIPVKGSVQLALTPAVPAGAFSLEVGPATLPTEPLGIEVDGKATLSDPKDEVMCLQLDGKIKDVVV